MGFHMISLLKRSVWLKILYIQKSDELFLETVECSHWWKIYFYKKILYKRKSCKGFFCKNKFSTNESTEFITGHVMGTWRRNCTILLPKTGGRAGPIWSCPKKPPHLSFLEWYHEKAHKKLEKFM